MASKADILSEILRTAAQNGGTPLGIERFYAETGIKTSDWQGKHWVRWGDALTEAGFQPNQLQGARSDEDLLSSLATFVRELGRLPVANELKLKARTEPGFPWHNTFAKFGNKKALVARLRDYCLEGEIEDVSALCDEYLNSAKAARREDEPRTKDVAPGYVYLLKHGSRREYKIGRTNNRLRREGEIGVELPEKVEPMHVIETDDPAGVEAYWHRRFAENRLRNEWFALSAEDVRAFKRWRRIY